MAVNGIVVKDTERELLIDAIRRVMAGEKVVQVDTGGGSALLSRKLRDHGLTRREYDIMRHVAMGQTNPDIADALGLTRNTVKTYLQRALDNLGARNGVEAFARANQLGISSRCAGVSARVVLPSSGEGRHWGDRRG